MRSTSEPPEDMLLKDTVHGTDPPRVTFVELPGNGSYESSVTYPQLQYKDRTLSRRVNMRLKREVVTHRNQWEQYLAGDRSDDTKAFRVDACSVMYASATLVSVGCDSYEFNGGAHGSKGYRALNLRLPSLHELSLKEIVRTDAGARRKLIALCDQSLAEQARFWDPPQPTASMRTEIGPEAEIIFKTFVLTERGIRFYFKDQLPHVNADVVTPYIAWSQLKDIARKQALVLASADVPYVRKHALWPMG